jgi:hemerythrin
MESTYFQWDKDFLTGVESIDAQHYGLVEIINDLLKYSLKNEMVELEQINDILNRLTTYVVEHFQTEDEMMLQAGVDERHVKVHDKLHRDFVDKVNRYFSDKEMLRVPEKLNEVSEFLVRWLAYHILNTDKSMVRQLEYIQNEGLSGHEAYMKERNHINTTSEPLLKALKALFYLVSQKNKELEKQNEILEQKVAERTAALEKANLQLREQSIMDVLTGLPNRRFVMEELDRLINLYDRYKTPFSVLFIDLDKFKEVNDTFGHEEGDFVLKWVADFLKNNVRKTDMPCRLGGDEFVIVCPGLDKEHSVLMAEKLYEVLSSKETQQDMNVWKPSFSIGVAQYDSTIGSASELLIQADSAMYEVKRKR